MSSEKTKRWPRLTRFRRKRAMWVIAPTAKRARRVADAGMSGVGVGMPPSGGVGGR